MPIKIKQDSMGVFYQWGNSGAKYYFNINSERSRSMAYDKLRKQIGAIFLSNYHKSKRSKSI